MSIIPPSSTRDNTEVLRRAIGGGCCCCLLRFKWASLPHWTAGKYGVLVFWAWVSLVLGHISKMISVPRWSCMEVCVNRFLTIFVEQKKQKIFSCVQLPEITRSLLDQLQQVTALQLVTLRDLVNLKKPFGEVILSMGWNELSDVWSMGSGGLPGGKWMDGVAFSGINIILPRFLVDICEIWFQEPIWRWTTLGHSLECFACWKLLFLSVIQSSLQKFDILRTPFK